MANRPKVIVAGIEREMNDEEFKQYEADQKAFAEEKLQKQNELMQKKLAREAAEAKLAALGLTTDDLKALGL